MIKTQKNSTLVNAYFGVLSIYSADWLSITQQQIWGWVKYKQMLTFFTIKWIQGAVTPLTGTQATDSLRQPAHSLPVAWDCAGC